MASLPEITNWVDQVVGGAQTTAAQARDVVTGGGDPLRAVATAAADVAAPIYNTAQTGVLQAAQQQAAQVAAQVAQRQQEAWAPASFVTHGALGALVGVIVQAVRGESLTNGALLGAGAGVSIKAARAMYQSSASQQLLQAAQNQVVGAKA